MDLRRLTLVIIGTLGLFAVYFFQDYLDMYSLMQWKAPQKLSYTADYEEPDKAAFIINKVARYIANDLFAIAIIAGLFNEKKYIRFSFYVMAFGLIVLLPVYVLLYFQRPEGFSSMLSHLHRIVMNPALMMLLVPAFYYQKSREHKGS